MTGVNEAGRGWFRREVYLCRSELARLRGLKHRPLSASTAAGSSLVVVLLGNAAVLAGQRWDEQREWITLVGIPAIGLVGVLLLVHRGWKRRDLGLQWPAVDPPKQLPYGIFATALVVAAGSLTGGLASDDDVLPLEVLRLLVGTAFGEELVHRGAVLGAWTSTQVADRWIVLANMATFGLWHLAGAFHADGLHWWEVAVPGIVAPVLLWGRLRARSELASASFHAAPNMTRFLPQL